MMISDEDSGVGAPQRVQEKADICQRDISSIRETIETMVPYD